MIDPKFKIDQKVFYLHKGVSGRECFMRLSAGFIGGVIVTFEDDRPTVEYSIGLDPPIPERRVFANEDDALSALRVEVEMLYQDSLRTVSKSVQPA